MHLPRNQLRFLIACVVSAALCGAALGNPPAGGAPSAPLLMDSYDWSSGDVVAPGSDHVPLMPAEQLDPTAAIPQSLNGEIPSSEFPLGTGDENCVPRGVRPYGGGSPGDWSWGCGGSPYRTGPGLCDDWKVGCRWHVAVDGIVLSRENTDLTALTAATDEDSAGNPLADPLLEQFDFGPGGRVMFISQVPHYVGYQMQFAYEGIEEWNAAVVYPRFSPMPGSADPDSSEQRSLHYRTSYHSAEINFVREWHPMLRPYCGVRYMKFDDEINDFIDQEAPPPLPADPAVTTTDRLNLFDLENNLIGFQIGSAYQMWRFGERLSIEGFFNAGVYYNRIKYTNLTGVFSRQDFPDGTFAVANAVNNDASELSEISYAAESSISTVCRLNRCWALRAGYQVLGIANLHLADDAFLDTGDDTQHLFFHGWHAGIECRR